MVDTVDAAINAQYAAMAAGGMNLRGMSVLTHAKTIGKLIRNHAAHTLLDYGSGAGDAYNKGELHKRWGILPVLYDPAFPELSQKPSGRFDGVICNDVLEHVPEPLVDAVIADLFVYAGKFVFASVCCRPAKKHFPDGRNLHITVQPYRWWARRFKAAAPKGIQWLLLESM